MYGKNVTVKLGDDITITVWVWCVPSTPDEVLRKRALGIVSERLTGKGLAL